MDTFVPPVRGSNAVGQTGSQATSNTGQARSEVVRVPDIWSSIDRPVTALATVHREGSNAGMFRLTTSSGDIVVRSSLPLSDGARVSVQLQAGNPPRLALIRMVGTGSGAGGMGPAGAGASPAPGAQTASAVMVGPAGSGIQAGTSPQILQPDAVLRAVVLHGQPAAGSTSGTVPTGPTVFPPGSSAGPGNAAGSAGAPGTGPTPAGLPSSLLAQQSLVPALPGAMAGRDLPTNAPTGQHVASGTPVGNPLYAATGLAAQQALALRVLAVFDPSASPSSLRPNHGGERFLATVNGTTPSGQTLLNSVAGTLGIRFATPPPQGTQILLEPVAARPSATGGTVLSPYQAAGTTALAAREALTILRAIEPGAAQALQSALPNVTNSGQMAPAMLFLLSALRLGTMRQALPGKVFDALDRAGRSDLARALGDDRSGGQRVRDESGAWRLYALPLIVGERVERIDVAVRHEPDDDDDDAAPRGKSQRFTIDLNLSRLGYLQLDGLASRGRVDLVLRGAAALGDDLRQAISQRFDETLAAMGIAGDLLFRDDTASPLAERMVPDRDSKDIEI